MSKQKLHINPNLNIIFRLVRMNLFTQRMEEHLISVVNHPRSLLKNPDLTGQHIQLIWQIFRLLTHRVQQQSIRRCRLTRKWKKTLKTFTRRNIWLNRYQFQFLNRLKFLQKYRHSHHNVCLHPLSRLFLMKMKSESPADQRMHNKNDVYV